MSVATAATTTVVRVAGVRPTGAGVFVEYVGGGGACLSESSPDYADILWHAEWASVERSYGPTVGATVGADGFLLDIGAAHHDYVYWLKDSEDNPDALVWVALWGYSAMCALAKDHPDFERIHATLTESAESHRMLWVVCHSRERIADPPDLGVEGGVGQFFQILDARPADTLADPAPPLPPPAHSG